MGIALCGASALLAACSTNVDDGGPSATADLSGSESLFGSSAPSQAQAADPDKSAVELGVRFSSKVAGQIQAIRFYRAVADRAGYSVHLWSSSGALLATATGKDASLPGWNTISLSSPIAISANTTYVASYFDSNGRYAATNEGFANGLTSGDLSAPASAGVYHYGSSPGFPSSTYEASNYWVDVSFVPAASSQDMGASGHSVALAWGASSTPSVTYDIYRGTTHGGPYTQIKSGVSGLTDTDDSVVAGETYYYVVRALDASGESSNSNEISAVIP